MLRAPLSLAAVALLSVSCNTFTGADDLEAAAAVSDPPPPFSLADGVTLSKIEVFQGLLRPFMTDGELDDSAIPLVEGRDALVRLYVDLDEGLDERELLVRFTFDQGEDEEPTVFETEVTADDTPGTFEAIDSTVNVTIPGDQLVGEAVRVELLMPTPLTTGLNGGAAFPAPGEEPAALDLHGSGVLKVVAIPVQYNADGSGRLPDTSEAQMARFRDLLLAQYPATDVEVRVDAPHPIDFPVSGGQGLSMLLDEIQALRDLRQAANDEYFYGFVAPADSFGEYCQGGCTTGLSLLAPDPNAWGLRASVGVGFPGDGSLETAVHEIGHAHGREHAPCGGAGNPDPNFPHAMGAIGTWGLDPTGADGMVLIPPEASDFMGYCPAPNWVSDYNFLALLERLDGVAQILAHRVPGPPVVWDRIRIDDDGARFLEPVSIGDMPLVGATTVRTFDGKGRTALLEGHYFTYDHLPGGVLYVPATDAVEAIFTADGRERRSTR